MKNTSRRYHSYTERNAALRLIRKSKGFLLLPFSWDDPAYTRRQAIARQMLGGNARVIRVRPTREREIAGTKSPKRRFVVQDEAQYAFSSDGSTLWDADLLAERLPKFHAALAELERQRRETRLGLPAWIFLSVGLIVSEEMARADIARSSALFEKATKIRKADADQDNAFFAAWRTTNHPPVTVVQEMSEFAEAATRLGNQIKAEYQADVRRDADLLHDVRELVRSLKGKTLDEAKKLAEDAGLRLRVLETENGRTIRTLEHDPNRCNVTVINGYIDAADLG